MRPAFGRPIRRKRSSQFCGRPDHAKLVAGTLTSFSSGDTVGQIIVGRLESRIVRGAVMVWRRISSLSSAGTTLGLIVLGACSVAVANELDGNSLGSAPAAQAGAAVASRAVRAPTIVITPSEPVAAGREVGGTSQLSPVVAREAKVLDKTVEASTPQELTPELEAILGDDSTLARARRLSARRALEIAKRKYQEKLAALQARSCPVVQATPLDRMTPLDRVKPQIATRRPSMEEHGATRVAVMLGVAF
jgi:hypothetical protein